MPAYKKGEDPMFAVKGDKDCPGRIRNPDESNRRRLRQTGPEEIQEVIALGNAIVDRWRRCVQREPA
jgi:hypothetical protein